jgi:hypothetical protein
MIRRQLTLQKSQAFGTLSSMGSNQRVPLVPHLTL